MAKTIVKGAIGLTKVALGIDRAPDDVIEARLAECVKCPHRIFGAPDKLVSLSRCRLCKCLVKQAAKVASKECPDGRWQNHLQNKQNKLV